MSSNLRARVIATESALALLASLREKYGPLMFFQTGSSNDSTSPLCYALSEFNIGSSDVYLGNLEGTPYYVENEQFDSCSGKQLIIDVEIGTGAKESLDFGTGMRFLTQARLISDD
jgi:uncharacterized protein (DUF779 family)